MFQAIFHWKSSDVSKEYWDNIGSKVIAVLSNGAKLDPNIFYDTVSLIKFVDTNFRKLLPEEKLDSVLEYFAKRVSFDGQSVILNTPTDNVANSFYFANANEWLYYLDNAIKRGFLTTEQDTYNIYHKLTIEGLNKLAVIQEKTNSRFCFVAMSFDDSMFEIYENVIASTIRGCGFEPYLVSNVNVESDKTINDAIIAGLKKARFTIADFTYHKDGVYFEAGYALGRGQQVIYTCRHDHMKNAHFDIRNYQHIIWNDAVDFQKKLTDKIEAFIV